jgi:hypothetical protein
MMLDAGYAGCWMLDEGEEAIYSLQLPDTRTAEPDTG